MHGNLADNPGLLEPIIQQAKSLHENVNIGVCPVALHIPQVRDLITAESGLLLGAQDCNEHDSGAFTGEVSASMLQESGVKLVLVGHSERRSIYGESDERVAEKFQAVINNQMTPVLCIGETLEQREQGQTEAVILQQLDAVLKKSGADSFSNGIIAYEPVWAIGTGKTATPEQAQQVHYCIRQWLQQNLGEAAQNISVLYGGSVKPDNAEMLFSQPDIDGGLIGGASLNAASFMAICAAAQ